MEKPLTRRFSGNVWVARGEWRSNVNNFIDLKTVRLISKRFSKNLKNVCAFKFTVVICGQISWELRTSDQSHIV